MILRFLHSLFTPRGSVEKPGEVVEANPGAELRAIGAAQQRAFQRVTHRALALDLQREWPY